eukprot:353415-Chlamydomonas_euryale.AAC.3
MAAGASSWQPVIHGGTRLPQMHVATGGVCRRRVHAHQRPSASTLHGSLPHLQSCTYGRFGLPNTRTSNARTNIRISYAYAGSQPM